MNRFLLTLTLTTALSATAFTAQARDTWPHWYVGLSGQLSFVDDAEVDLNGTNVGEASFSSEYALSAALGYRPYPTDSLLDYTRWELEYTYRDQAFDDFSFNGGGNAPMNGDLVGNSVMANMFFDINTGGKLTPYVGGGIGMTWWEFDSPDIGVDGNDGVFSYQGMLGFYYSPETMPNTDWGIGYRYFGTQDPEFSDSLGNSIEHDYSSHNMEFRANFRF